MSDAAKTLAPYAVEPRYPGPSEPLQQEAEVALRLAREVTTFVVDQLPLDQRPWLPAIGTAIACSRGMGRHGERPRVLVAEHSADFGALLATVLQEAGYDARWTIGADQPAELVAQVGPHAPDLLVLDLDAGLQRAYVLLDALRAAPETAAVPVLLLTLDPHLVEAALASYNVKQALLKPFELPQLTAAVARLLGESRARAGAFAAPAPGDMSATSADPLRRAEQVLAAHAREALFHWVQRLVAEEPWRRRTDLRMGQILDCVPQLVATLVNDLHRPGARSLFTRRASARKTARAAAHTRRAQGIPLQAVMREHDLLDEELWTALRRHLLPDLATRDRRRLTAALRGALLSLRQEVATAYRQPAGTDSAAA